MQDLGSLLFVAIEMLVTLAFEANEMTEWGSIVLRRREIYMLSVHCHARSPKLISRRWLWLSFSLVVD